MRDVVRVLTIFLALVCRAATRCVVIVAHESSHKASRWRSSPARLSAARLKAGAARFSSSSSSSRVWTEAGVAAAANMIIMANNTTAKANTCTHVAMNNISRPCGQPNHKSTACKGDVGGGKRGPMNHKKF